MTGSTAARRAVSRWSLRLLRREWRQQLLVICLITTATGVSLLAAIVAYQTASSRDAEFGSAESRLEFQVSEPDALAPYVDAARDWFGTIEVIDHREVPVPGSTEGVELRSQAIDGVYGSPMLALRSGRYPESADEVALTDDVAALLGVGVGDESTLGNLPREVVGTVENPHDLEDEFALVAGLGSEGPGAITILTGADEERLRSFRPPVEPGSGFFDSRGTTEKVTAALLVFVVSTVAMLLVSLVAGAAFITLAHRRMRQLGMLAAVGASPRHIRTAMLANGAAVGAVAAIGGIALALGAWVATASALEPSAHHRIDRWDLPLWLIAGSAAIAVATATIAAWWPARSVSRVPITEALAARPPRPTRVHRSVLLALLLLVGGVAGLAFGIDPSSDSATPLLFIPGLVASVAAVVLLASPALRAAAAFAGGLPIAMRLSLRDLTRFRSRSGAALGAISLGLAIAVSVVVIAAAAAPRAENGNMSARQMIVWTSDRGGLDVAETTAAEIGPLEDVVDRMARGLDGATVVPLDVATDAAHVETQGLERVLPAAVLGRRVNENTLRDSGRIYVATPELLAHLEIDPDAIPPTSILLTPQQEAAYITGDLDDARFRSEPVPGDRVEHVDTSDYSSVPRTLITAAGLEAAGLAPMRAGWLIEAPRAIDESRIAEVRTMAADAGLLVETRDEKPGLVTVRTAASAAGVLLALGILAMTLGLLRGDAVHDLRTLAATGATSRDRRALSASTAAVLATLGVLLGITSAYVMMLASYWPATERLSNVPVVHLVAIAVGFPLLATATSWALGGGSMTGIGRSSVD